MSRPGPLASARAIAGLAVGQQADWVVLDAHDLLLQGLPSAEAMLSAHVFASHRQSALDAVWVGGQPRVQAGRHALHDSALSDLAAARQQLLMDTP